MTPRTNGFSGTSSAAFSWRAMAGSPDPSKPISQRPLSSEVAYNSVSPVLPSLSGFSFFCLCSVLNLYDPGFYLGPFISNAIIIDHKSTGTEISQLLLDIRSSAHTLFTPPRFLPLFGIALAFTIIYTWILFASHWGLSFLRPHWTHVLHQAHITGARSPHLLPEAFMSWSNNVCE